MKVQNIICVAVVHICIQPYLHLCPSDCSNQLLIECCNNRLLLFLSLTSFRSDFVKPRSIYNRLGQFDYQNPDYTDDLIEDNGANKEGIKRIYIGQTKEGTKIWDGIGIWVWPNGYTPVCVDNNYTHEGYWKDGMRNGPGRLTADAE